MLNALIDVKALDVTRPPLVNCESEVNGFITVPYKDDLIADILNGEDFNKTLVFDVFSEKALSKTMTLETFDGEDFSNN